MNWYLPLVDRIVASAEEFSWAIPLEERQQLEPSRSFVEGTQFQHSWDSVSLAALKTCPRYYQYKIIEGWSLWPMPSPLQFGIAFHTLQETYHKLKAHGIDQETATLRCVRLAGLLGERLPAGRTERTKETLIRSFVWYMEQFKSDPATTALKRDGSPAVEFSFTLPITEIDGQEIYLCGHLDRVVQFQGDTLLADYKTTKGQLNERFLAQFKPNTQISGYATAGYILATQPNPVFPSIPKGVIIDAVELGVNYNRFQRFVMRFTQLELNEWLSDFISTIRVKALGYAQEGRWPMEETSCDRYGGCEFREVCSKNPAERQRVLEKNFRKSIWDPRKAR